MGLLVGNATGLGGDAGDRGIHDQDPDQERGRDQRYGMETRAGRRP